MNAWIYPTADVIQVFDQLEKLYKKIYVLILEEKVYDHLSQRFMGWFNGTYKLLPAVDISKKRGSKKKSQIKEEVYISHIWQVFTYKVRNVS